MKRGSTVFLKIVIVLIGLAVLAGLIGLPLLEGRNANADLVSIYFKDPLLAYVYVASLPFFMALQQAFKLLGHIERNQTFSPIAVKTLRNIKYCATALIGFGTVSMPLFYYWAQEEDAPGIIVIGLVMLFACLVIATAAAVFERLLQNAVDIKAENDLTI